jgi:hypothetical protein
MRKASMQFGIKIGMKIGMVGLMVVATAGTVRAQDSTVAAASAPAPVRRMQVSLVFLPMSNGSFTAVYGGMPATLDAAFAPGGAISVGWDVKRGLLFDGDRVTVGLAPQVLFNVKPKEDPISTDPAAAIEIDAMARVAYSYSFTDTIAIYGAALPGYSLVKPKIGDPAKGLVFGFDIGAIMGLTERTFVSLGGGYQWGFQTRTDTSRMTVDGMEKVTKVTTDVRPEYWRVALGVGVRF